MVDKGLGHQKPRQADNWSGEILPTIFLKAKCRAVPWPKSHLLGLCKSRLKLNHPRHFSVCFNLLDKGGQWKSGYRDKLPWPTRYRPIAGHRWVASASATPASSSSSPLYLMPSAPPSATHMSTILKRWKGYGVPQMQQTNTKSWLQDKCGIEKTQEKEQRQRRHLSLVAFSIQDKKGTDTRHWGCRVFC